MKKLLLFVTMAASLLFTQCKKDDKNSMPSAGKTVSMTVTAGPGSKTDITDEGRITWSAGDKLYVGDGEKYIGYLTLKSGANSATGVFSGNVDLPTSVKDGDKPTFHFYYLGSADHTDLAKNATSVEVDFSSQDIIKGTDGKLTNASKYHVGYGSAKGTVIGEVVTDINVWLVSKVAIARFSFTKDKSDYTGALTLSGTNICNKMTVNFNSAEFACTGTKGNISLTNETTSEKDETTSEKYVMLVPTSETTGSQELTFEGDGVSGKTTLEKGIEANKFYGKETPIEVPLKATVKMTVTAGPGSKTDITTAGAITWSAGDKLYVGDGEKYIGYLTLVSGEGSATGFFTGNVTLPTSVKDGGQTFHFFYLGNAKLTLGDGATSVDVSFDKQTGLLGDLGSCHVGYGSAKGTVTGNMVTDINVMMVSKVALAHFNVKKDNVDYGATLTLSGDNICNKMTVKFDGTGFSYEGTKGNISLGGGNGDYYVMLVPTDETTGEQKLTFTSTDNKVSGTATLDNILPNQFYGKSAPITVTLTPKPKFSVSGNTTVEFAPGNLWYGKVADEETAAFHFESNQWKTQPTSDDQWNPNHVSHFFWSKDEKVAYAASYSDELASTSDVFFTNDPSDDTKPNKNFKVDGEAASTWRTLSIDEWDYLIERTVNGGKGEGKSYQRATVNGVYGLILYPDNYTGQTSSTSYTSAEWTLMESAGVVFLPAAGIRNDANVSSVGSLGNYWSSTPLEEDMGYPWAYGIMFDSEYITVSMGDCSFGYPVRLVR